MYTYQTWDKWSSSSKLDELSTQTVRLNQISETRKFTIQVEFCISCSTWLALLVVHRISSEYIHCDPHYYPYVEFCDILNIIIQT